MDMQKIREAWKAVVAAIPGVVFLVLALVDAMTGAGIALPPWAISLVSFLTAVGVWAKRNGSTSPEGLGVPESGSV